MKVFSGTTGQLVAALEYIGQRKSTGVTDSTVVLAAADKIEQLMAEQLPDVDKLAAINAHKSEPS